MAKRVKDATLDSPEARRRLKVAGKPYYKTIDRGLHLGYRKGKRGGMWVARCYVDGDYVVETFAPADDARDADGCTVLDYWQAQAKAREICARKQREAAGLEEPTGSYAVAQAIDDYLDHLRDNNKPSTVTDTEYRAKALIVPALGAIEGNSLTTKRIRTWHTSIARAPARLRTKEGAKQNIRSHDTADNEAVRKRKASANRLLTILKAALNQAWRDGHIRSDEQWRKVQPYRNVDAARVRYLTVEEARRLLNACAPDLRDLVQGALASGCRYGELTAVNASDFDPDNGQLHIRQSKSGKGRHVVLNDEGRALFKRLTAGRPGDSPIFRKVDGGRWGPAHQGRPFAAAIERAKITPPTSFHVLRHTYASLSIMNGAPPMVVAENLGHADTRMIERTYGHLTRKYVVDQIRAAAPSFGMVEPGNVERLESVR